MHLVSVSAGRTIGGSKFLSFLLHPFPFSFFPFLLFLKSWLSEHVSLAV